SNRLIILINTSININLFIMNKKFSTLLAGMALVAAVSANAQTSIDVNNGKIDINTTAETLPKYDKDTKGGLYQLRDANGQILRFLSVETEGSLKESLVS
ncbi:hypothetical protein VPJ68_09300, partial [Parabacteroides distasonis]